MVEAVLASPPISLINLLISGDNGQKLQRIYNSPRMVAMIAALTAALFPLASPRLDIMPIMDVGVNDEGEN